MRRKLFIVLSLVTVAGLITWSIAYGIGTIWSNTDVDPSNHDFSNLPEAMLVDMGEVPETNPLVVQSKIQKQKREQEIQDATARLTGELKKYQNKEVIPNEFWPVNSGKDQAIVIRNMEIEQILSRETIATFINIPNSPFPGIVFEMTPSSSDQSVNEKEIKILRQIVSSITFEE